MSVTSTGKTILVCTQALESVDGGAILRTNLERHNSMLEERVKELNLSDSSFYYVRYPNFWSVLCDKAYDGLYHLVRSTCSQKAPLHKFLFKADERINEKVSADRIIVENVFGQLL